MKKTTPLIFLFVSFLLSNQAFSQSEKVFFTNGFKTGEITQKSVVLWTRLCASEKPNPVKHHRSNPPIPKPINFNDDVPIPEMDGAVLGSIGEVKLEISNVNKHITIDWTSVKKEKDFTYKTYVNNLKPNTKYEVIITGRKAHGKPETEIKGSFTTAPENHQSVPITFTSSTCQYFWSYDDKERGFKIYDAMSNLNPDFFIQSGDYVYYDKPGPMVKDMATARHKWNAMNGWPSLIDFFKNCPLLIQKDDHDVLKNDSGPHSSPLGSLTFEQGVKIWNEQNPTEESPYRTFRWGKDLQIWLIEVREFRGKSKNNSENTTNNKILGKKQIDWFKKSVKKSDATFKILLSPTPFVGPDRPNKNDNHANKTYRDESHSLKKFMEAQNMYILVGDRHWQYVSKDEEFDLWEFGQGAVSDEHAGGWKKNNRMPQHKHLRVKGGFLSTSIYKENKTPVIKFTHYDVDGNPVHEEKFFSKK